MGYWAQSGTRHLTLPIAQTVANGTDSMNVSPTKDFIPLGAERSTLKAGLTLLDMGLSVSLMEDQTDRFSFRPFHSRRLAFRRSFEGKYHAGHTKEARAVSRVQHRPLPSATDQIRDTDFRGMIQKLRLPPRSAADLDMPEKPRSIR